MKLKTFLFSCLLITNYLAAQKDVDAHLEADLNSKKKNSFESTQWDAEIDKAKQLWKDGQKDSTFTILLTLEAKGIELSEEIRWKIYRTLAWRLRDIGELHAALEYKKKAIEIHPKSCLLYTSPSPRDS